MDSENRRINWYSVAFCVVFISCLPPYLLMQTLSRLRWFCFELSFVPLSWDKSIQQLWTECLLCTCHYTSVAEGSAVNKADKNLCPHVASVLIRLLQQFIIPTWEACGHTASWRKLCNTPHMFSTQPLLWGRDWAAAEHTSWAWQGGKDECRSPGHEKQTVHREGQRYVWCKCKLNPEKYQGLKGIGYWIPEDLRVRWYLSCLKQFQHKNKEGKAVGVQVDAFLGEWELFREAGAWDGGRGEVVAVTLKGMSLRIVCGWDSLTFKTAPGTNACVCVHTYIYVSKQTHTQFCLHCCLWVEAACWSHGVHYRTEERTPDPWLANANYVLLMWVKSIIYHTEQGTAEHFLWEPCTWLSGPC